MKAVDELGLPGTIDNVTGRFDGGDTASILGNVIALANSPMELERGRIMLIKILGKHAPVRHPDKTKWYGQEDRFSRDQLIPVICAGINLKRSTTVDVIFNWHKARKFLTAWNTKKNGAMDVPDKRPDITGPEIWALWIRYKRPDWAKWVLWILDLETLVGSMLWRWWQPSTNRLTRNHMLICITGMRRDPSFIMRMAYALNDWPDLWNRWRGHCQAVGEFDTYSLFNDAINKN